MVRDVVISGDTELVNSAMFAIGFPHPSLILHLCKLILHSHCHQSPVQQTDHNAEFQSAWANASIPLHIQQLAPLGAVCGGGRGGRAKGRLKAEGKGEESQRGAGMRR